MTKKIKVEGRHKVDKKTPAVVKVDVDKILEDIPEDAIIRFLGEKIPRAKEPSGEKIKLPNKNTFVKVQEREVTDLGEHCPHCGRAGFVEVQTLITGHEVRAGGGEDSPV